MNDTLEEQILSGQSTASERRNEKKILVALLLLAGVLTIVCLAVFFFVPYYGLGNIHPALPFIMATITVVLAIMVIVTLTLLVIATMLGRDVPFSRKLRSVVIKVLLPLLIQIGKLVGIKKEQVQHAFVTVNNELVMAHCKSTGPPKRILLLMPHCLQNSDCPVKITYRVENCKRCGKCSIKSLLELAETYDVDLAVATGGTIARRIVVEKRPQLIVAVACERDLTSGIKDTTPLPVYGIFNRRPFGPCMNTQVDLRRIESVLKLFRKPKQVAPKQVAS